MLFIQPAVAGGYGGHRSDENLKVDMKTLYLLLCFGWAGVLFAESGEPLSVEKKTMPVQNEKTYRVERRQLKVPDSVERVLFISDIHSRFEFLKIFEAATALDGRTQVVVAGDLLHGGAFPVETMDWVMKHAGEYAILGNHDENVLAWEADASRPPAHEAGAKALLSPRHLDYLDGLADELTLSWNGKTIHVMHGHRDRSENGVAYTTPAGKLVEIFSDDAVDLTVIGHTHVPFVYQDQKTAVINCGAISDFLSEKRNAPAPTWIEARVDEEGQLTVCLKGIEI